MILVFPIVVKMDLERVVLSNPPTTPSKGSIFVPLVSVCDLDFAAPWAPPSPCIQYVPIWIHVDHLLIFPIPEGLVRIGVCQLLSHVQPNLAHLLPLVLVELVCFLTPLFFPLSSPLRRNCRVGGFLTSFLFFCFRHYPLVDPLSTIFFLFCSLCHFLLHFETLSCVSYHLSECLFSFSLSFSVQYWGWVWGIKPVREKPLCCNWYRQIFIWSWGS